MEKIKDNDLREIVTAELAQNLDIPFADAEEILDKMDQETIKNEEVNY